MTDLNNEIADLRNQIEMIADQLCVAVKGDFDFTIQTQSTNESLQKLNMLINFVLDAARRALHTVKEKNAKLTELDKLKSDFMATISHELRTPLTLILGPLENILEDPTLSAQQLNNLQCVQRNAMRLYMLVNDVLDFSKLEAGKYYVHDDLVEINQLVSQLIEDSQGLAIDRKLHLHFSGCPELQSIIIDRKMIEKILMNLVSNALKFTHENGSVDVSISRIANDLVLVVKDTGIGIPEQQIDKLFEQFYQVNSSTTRAHEGTGIGLAICQQFTQLLKGNIAVKSEVGKGTQFTVTLPIKLPSDISPTPDEKDSSKAKPIKAKLSLLAKTTSTVDEATIINLNSDLPLILISDDNDDMRAYIISILKSDYKLLAVKNGQQALSAIYQYSPQVVLSDIMMPIMDGYQLTKAIKADPKIRHTPIILITAKSGKGAISSSLEVGADDYLSKPFSQEELIARTHTALKAYQHFIINQDLNNKLVIASRKAGMNDTATSVLHNVGNILNSINTSISMLERKVDSSKMSNLGKLNTLLQKHQNDIVGFITNDAKGQQVPSYITELSHTWDTEKTEMVNEINGLKVNIQHIKEVISKQNALNVISDVAEDIDVPKLIGDAVTLNQTAFEKEHVNIVQECDATVAVVGDRVKLLQVIVNLIKNSIESVLENNVKNKKIHLKTFNTQDNQICIQIKDNGIGIESNELNKIFTYGFTTKKDGHGFGLHSSSNAIQEMGGNITADSEGLGKGATFTIKLPCTLSIPKEKNL